MGDNSIWKNVSPSGHTNLVNNRDQIYLSSDAPNSLGAQHQKHRVVDKECTMVGEAPMIIRRQSPRTGIVRLGTSARGFTKSGSEHVYDAVSVALEAAKIQQIKASSGTPQH